jgi:ferredoxin
VKATVDDSCIACGLCVDVCPEVFKMSESDDLAEVIVDEVPEVDQSSCREAAEGCPVDAIELTD